MTLLLLILPTGCIAAGQDITLEQPPVSGSLVDGGGQAEIVCVRPGIGGWMEKFPVYINGESVGTAKVNDTVRKRVAPGTATILVKGEVDSVMRFPVEPNRAYYIDVEPAMGWARLRVRLAVMDPKRGKDLMERFEKARREKEARRAKKKR